MVEVNRIETQGKESTVHRFLPAIITTTSFGVMGAGTGYALGGHRPKFEDFMRKDKDSFEKCTRNIKKNFKNEYKLLYDIHNKFMKTAEKETALSIYTTTDNIVEAFQKICKHLPKENRGKLMNICGICSAVVGLVSGLFIVYSKPPADYVPEEKPTDNSEVKKV